MENPPPGPVRPPQHGEPPRHGEPPGMENPPQHGEPPSAWRTPPPEADSSIRSTSGRYTSYWNAFLLINYVCLFILQVAMGVCKIHSFWPSVPFSSTFGVFLVIIEFIGPLIILIYCYGRIVWVLTRRINSTLETTGTRADTFQLARKNTLKTFLLISICFVICWSCEQGFYLMYNIGFHVDFHSTFFKVSILMAFVNCTINPFVYLIKYKDYQQALKHCFNCTRPTTSNEQIKNSSIFSTSAMSVGGIWVFPKYFHWIRWIQSLYSIGPKIMAPGLCSQSNETCISRGPRV